MGDVEKRLEEHLEAEREARREHERGAQQRYEMAARRRGTALRLPPLLSGHRDPLGKQTDAPDRRWSNAGGGC